MGDWRGASPFAGKGKRLSATSRTVRAIDQTSELILWRDKATGEGEPAEAEISSAFSTGCEDESTHEYFPPRIRSGLR